MIIDNVKIYTEAGTFVSGGIITQGDKITEIYTEAEKENIFKKMNMETEHTAAQCSVQDYSAMKMQINKTRNCISTLSV